MDDERKRRQRERHLSERMLADPLVKRAARYKRNDLSFHQSKHQSRATQILSVGHGPDRDLPVAIISKGQQQLAPTIICNERLRVTDISRECAPEGPFEGANSKMKNKCKPNGSTADEHRAGANGTIANDVNYIEVANCLALCQRANCPSSSTDNMTTTIRTITTPATGPRSGQHTGKLGTKSLPISGPPQANYHRLVHLIVLLTLAVLLNNIDHICGRERPSHMKSIESERQFQLLRSANVELSRRTLQRPQREATPALDASVSGSSVAAGTPTCGYPGSPAHASVTFNTTHVVAGTAASYTCDNGYELLGPPRRVCQANGTWSPVGIPFCGK